MSESPLPELRPVRLQGKAYFQELRRLLKEERMGMLANINMWKREHGGITPEIIGALAVKHRINFKATCEFLEDERVIACGTYDKIKDGGLRPTQCLRAGQAWLITHDAPETAIGAAFKRVGIK